MSEQIELDILDKAGKSVGKKAASSVIFDAELSPHLLHQVVRWQRARKRAGTHSVLTRAEMSGGGAKPWRQKGTGRARAGSNTSPLWVGGGIAHGPKPRDYDFRMNKEEKRQALCSALSQRRKEGRLSVLSSFDLNKPQTKAAESVLRALGTEAHSKVLVVLGEVEEAVVKSLRNIRGVKVIAHAGLNVYDVLNAEYVIITDSALNPIEARLA